MRSIHRRIYKNSIVPIKTKFPQFTSNKLKLMKENQMDHVIEKFRKE